MIVKILWNRANTYETNREAINDETEQTCISEELNL